MQGTCENFTICSFCKKSASHLVKVTHSLCDCCLVHFECNAAFVEESVPVIPLKVDAVLKVECNFCLEKYRNDELQYHRMSCLPPRWIFRCSVCDGDYLTKEGLWNHLAGHEIANEKKELQCQEMKATYKFYNCTICNDQRCYKEKFYWRHVHEDHDGFFLRCSGCSESFRSHKLKTDHVLNHCKSREQIVPSESAELDVDYAYGITNADKNYLSNTQQDQYEGPEKDIEHLQTDQVDQQVVRNSPEDNQGNCDDSLTNHNETFDVEDNGKIIKNCETEEKAEETGESSDVKCPHCDKQYGNERNLRQHILYYHTPAACEICGVFFSSGNKARYHKAKTHSKNIYKCSDCSKEFLLRPTYLRHLLTHQTERKFLCKECGSTFKTAGVLRKHEKDVHIRYENLQIDCTISDATKMQEQKKTKAKKVTKIDCPTCRESFNDHDELSQHIQEMHQQFMCTICKMNFTNAHELTEHKCTVCSDCGKECQNQMRLEKHIKMYHELIKCDICGIVIPGESQLILHKLKVHGEPRYKCPHCSKKFHLKISYQRHMDKHSDIKNFSCEFCDRKFKSWVYVISHMRRIHRLKMTRKDVAKYRASKRNDDLNEKEDGTAFNLESIVEVGETMFLKTELPPESSSIENAADDANLKGKRRNQKVSRAIGENPPAAKPSDTACPHCGKECHNKKRLVQHLSYGHEPSECDICGLSFVGKSQANYHKLTVHSEPKFKCHKCPMKFHLKNSLDRHLPMHEKYSKEHPCTSCDSKFKTFNLLKKHMQHVHMIRKLETNLEKELEVQNAEKLSIKVEPSEEESPTQQHKSPTLDDDDEKISLQISTTKGNPSVNCPHCDKKFHQECNLIRHIKGYHEPTSCEICGIAFVSKYQLGYHKKINHKEPRFECPHCQQKFHVKHSFDNHVKRHGTNTFPCKFCTLMFKKAISLSLHVKQTHLNKKAFATKDETS